MKPCQATTQSRGDSKRHRGLSLDQLQEPSTVQPEHLAITLCNNGRRARAIGEQRHFAHRVTRRERPHPERIDPVLAREVNAEATLRHQEKGVARIPLAHEHVSRRHRHRLQVRRKLGEGHPIHAGKQVYAGEQPSTLGYVGSLPGRSVHVTESEPQRGDQAFCEELRVGVQLIKGGARSTGCAAVAATALHSSLGGFPGHEAKGMFDRQNAWP